MSLIVHTGGTTESDCSQGWPITLFRSLNNILILYESMDDVRSA